jgi:hypothetical protein
MWRLCAAWICRIGGFPRASRTAFLNSALRERADASALVVPRHPVIDRPGR